MRLLIVCLCIGLLVDPAFLFSAKRNKKRANVFFVTGSPSHGTGQHEWYAGAFLLSRGLREHSSKIKTSIVKHGWARTDRQRAALKKADTLVGMCDGQGKHLIHKNLDTFKKLIDKHVNLVCIHYGVHINRNQNSHKVFYKALGGYYQHGISTNPHWLVSSNNLTLNKEHPITRGVKPFSVFDEWYFNLVFKKDIVPILSAVPDDEARQGKTSWPKGPHPHIVKDSGKKEVLMWAYTRADGARSVGFTGLHYHKNFENEDFYRLLLNSIVWASHMKVPEGGLKPSKPNIRVNLDR